jgi:hypothetical protein
MQEYCGPYTAHYCCAFNRSPYYGALKLRHSPEEHGALSPETSNLKSDRVER